MMKVCCLDLEGVLVPEIWIRTAETTGIKELRLTTRDIQDYDKLMKYRLEILERKKITLPDIQKVISRIKPLPGAAAFLKALQAESRVIILSDTFAEFAHPLMKQLGFPTLFCHSLIVDKKRFIKGYELRQKNAKQKAVEALKKLNFKVFSAGDSYNDLPMLKAAHKGIFFNPPARISKEYPQFPVTKSYKSLMAQLLS